MTDAAFAWRGVDSGREGLLGSEAWLGVLETLSQHEGENLRRTDSQVYEDLSKRFPDVSWIGEKGDRPFFRDYAKPWTSTGVLRPNADTDGLLELTDKGRALVAAPTSSRDFFRDFIDAYLEHGDGETGSVSLGFSPFALIAKCLTDSPGQPVPILDLQKSAETRLLGQPVPDSDTSNRRFRTYLVFLQNAGAISVDTSGVSIVDHTYLKEIGAGTEAVPVEETDEELGTEDHRDFETRTVAKREGQLAFAQSLHSAYGGACCITGTQLAAVLEAAHILPYRGRKTNQVRNGLLLAVDIHRMFDKRLLGVSPEYRIELAPSVTDSRYHSLDGQELRLPSNPGMNPSPTYLSSRFDAFRKSAG
jgi:hypothetical protein